MSWKTLIQIQVYNVDVLPIIVFLQFIDSYVERSNSFKSMPYLFQTCPLGTAFLFGSWKKKERKIDSIRTTLFIVINQDSRNGSVKFEFNFIVSRNVKLKTKQISAQFMPMVNNSHCLT